MKRKFILSLTVSALMLFASIVLTGCDMNGEPDFEVYEAKTYMSSPTSGTKKTTTTTTTTTTESSSSSSKSSSGSSKSSSSSSGSNKSSSSSSSGSSKSSSSSSSSSSSKSSSSSSSSKITTLSIPSPYSYCGYALRVGENGLRTAQGSSPSYNSYALDDGVLDEEGWVQDYIKYIDSNFDFKYIGDYDWGVEYYWRHEYYFKYTGSSNVSQYYDKNSNTYYNLRVSVVRHLDRNDYSVYLDYPTQMTLVETDARTTKKLTKASGSSGSSGSSSSSSSSKKSGTNCLICKGSGDCTKCGGRGYVYSSASKKYDRNCPECNTSRKCIHCHGTGKI